VKAVEIIRVSTQEQGSEDRAGLPRQKVANLQTVNKHGLTIIKTIEIIDVSGTSVLHTPEIRGMIQMMRSGQIGGVVVADWDRLIRLDNFNDFALLQHFKETHTLIYLPDQVIDLNTQSGFLIGGFQSIISGNELTQIKKRMLAAKEVKRRNGEHPNCDITLPTGVGYDREGKRFHYTEDSEKVKLLFDLFCHEGIINYCELQRRTGIKHRTVPNLLKNEIYIGYRSYTEKRGAEKKIGSDGRQTDRAKIQRSPDEIIKVRVIDDPLIDEATFQKAQDLMRSKNRRYHAKRSRAGQRFLYSGFLKCGCCGEIMYSTSGGRNHHRDYYLCKSKNYLWVRKNGSSDCKTRYLPRDKVDHNVTSFISEALTDKDYLEKIITAALSSETYQEQKAESDMLEGMLTRISVKKDKLLDLYSDGIFNKDELNNKVSELNDQESALKLRLLKARASQGLSPDRIHESILPIVLTLEAFPYWTPRQKRTFMKSQLPEITITNDGLSGFTIGVSTPRNRTGMDSWLQ
jgi:site-specific DNA recombinase